MRLPEVRPSPGCGFSRVMSLIVCPRAKPLPSAVAVWGGERSPIWEKWREGSWTAQEEVTRGHGLPRCFPWFFITWFELLQSQSVSGMAGDSNSRVFRYKRMQSNTCSVEVRPAV